MPYKPVKLHRYACAVSQNFPLRLVDLDSGCGYGGSVFNKVDSKTIHIISVIVEASSKEELEEVAIVEAMKRCLNSSLAKRSEFELIAATDYGEVKT